MKKISIKKMLQLMSIIMLASVVLVSCKKDDDEDPEPTPTPVEDGIYVVGSGTALTDFNINGLMKPTLNEVDQTERASLRELFVAVKGGDGFNIIRVAGAQRTTYGPGADFAEVAEADLQTDEPRTGKFWRGSLAETDAKFVVPEDGLYHVVYDTELGIVVVAHAKWGVIGAATPGGWSDNTPMTAAFDLNKMEFQVTEMTMLQNSWKFRYSDGWKIFMDAEGTVKVNTNLGGTVEAPTPGGADLTNAEYGVYTVTLTWELGKTWVGSTEKTGEGEPLPEYPEAVYLVGDGTAYGWDAPGGNEEAIFHKAAGGTPSEGIYWKIAHLEGGLGFKISAADWTAPNLGFAEVEEFDAEGVEVVDNGGNMSIGESGMYIIVLNLRDEMTKVSVKPAEVYGIGDAFGGWDEDAEANKFVVDNAAKTLTSPALVADGSIRMYAQHNWIQDWWNAEFNVFDGKILYRNDGGDQEAVAGTTGQVITLMFDDNTGTIQ
jgi:hypothetical protein